MVADPIAQLHSWMKAPEDEHLEFKEAKSKYGFEKLVKYCAALANERGGKVILGVTDRRPRRVVGTQAFADLERTKAGLVERLHLRVDAYAIPHRDGRVVVFDVPSRPIGVPIQYRGAYWMRGGESLVAMTNDTLSRIFAESIPDFSAEVCPGARLKDLDSAAIERFRRAWRRKSGNLALQHISPAQLLADAELAVEGGITYAALVLFGTLRALGKHLPQAEVVFEYRAQEASIACEFREELRQGFFLAYDALWQAISRRNDVQTFRDGLLVWEVPTFGEVAVREAILNAVSHRDYRQTGSVFVRQSPRTLGIVSPGGLPPGVTLDNILWRQAPRNRRLAEALSRCGLVERSGQGIDRMFEACIRDSKPQPDFAGTDDYQVAVTLRGEVQDARFIHFLEKTGREKRLSFTLQDLIVLDRVHREEPVPAGLRRRLDYLAEQGVVETIGRGREQRHILSRACYGFLGRGAAYTRKRGLDRETNKALLFRHLESSGRSGCPFGELTQVVPALSKQQVQRLLADLRSAGSARHVGRGRAARWIAVPHTPDAPPALFGA